MGTVPQSPHGPCAQSGPELGVVPCTCKPSTMEAEAGRLRVQGQPRLLRGSCSKRRRGRKAYALWIPFGLFSGQGEVSGRSALRAGKLCLNAFPFDQTTRNTKHETHGLNPSDRPLLFSCTTTEDFEVYSSFSSLGFSCS